MKFNENVVIYCKTYYEMKELCKLLDEWGYKTCINRKWVEFLENHRFVKYINPELGFGMNIEEIELMDGAYTLINFEDIAPRYYWKLKGDWGDFDKDKFLIFYWQGKIDLDELHEVSKTESSFTQFSFTESQFLQICKIFNLEPKMFKKINTKDIEDDFSLKKTGCCRAKNRD